MFLTQTDLINAKISAEAGYNLSKCIKDLINEDIISRQKKLMTEGERYYVSEHDVENMDFRSKYISETVYDKEELHNFRNPNRSNHHIVNSFHKILVDQKASYIVGREPTVSVLGAESDNELKEYENHISNFTKDFFNETIQDLVIGASNKGFECLHIYYDENGVLKYLIVPSNEVIPIYDTTHQTELVELIRYYNITIVKGKKKVIRKKVEWWTKKNVTYYCEDDYGEFYLDSSIEVNPLPHWFTVSEIDGIEKTRVPHSWGRVPFIILKNNSKLTTDLQPIKALIDAYDLISSEGTNSLLDLVELYWVIQGYGGETAAAIASKLQINRAVSISDAGGAIDAKQVDIPVTGRIEWLSMLRRDIFRFGMGIDIDNFKFGSAPSGVSLKFQYTLLDLKANALSVKIKGFIKDFFYFVTMDLNRRLKKNYNYKQIEVRLNKSMITNDLDTVNMIIQSKGLVSDKTLLAIHPFVDDVNAEMIEKEVIEQTMI
ncbi:MAG: phage portal protein [Anaerotignaceae bacterium]